MHLGGHDPRGGCSRSDKRQTAARLEGHAELQHHGETGGVTTVHTRSSRHVPGAVPSALHPPDPSHPQRVCVAGCGVGSGPWRCCERARPTMPGARQPGSAPLRNGCRAPPRCTETGPEATRRAARPESRLRRGGSRDHALNCHVTLNRDDSGTLRKPVTRGAAETEMKEAAGRARVREEGTTARAEHAPGPPCMRGRASPKTRMPAFSPVASERMPGTLLLGGRGDAP